MCHVCGGVREGIRSVCIYIMGGQIGLTVSAANLIPRPLIQVLFVSSDNFKFMLRVRRLGPA